MRLSEPYRGYNIDFVTSGRLWKATIFAASLATPFIDSTSAPILVEDLEAARSLAQARINLTLLDFASAA
ncbi:hypothetical protein GJW-30_1_04161 [Variibacter gotjawalensis]|jgi:hypothetical protein|uniref:Uncharacterized protein n=1 Tax=Variibacter gotjawalensis TaxID=1333996 RepID=A0A0S3Q0B3_9BRAD|nr:hypothetical protein [Variibacter gotjawalensis]NIK47443.1 hypothetical protein [Variibacter gotjawalensis]RZS49338.1 hypothetical protein EV661_1768 [Variibacter gotjawalensis]BAT61602.1 hypothetical protein GJW-30_1_04161 [Variibacter gotjawalensis]